MAGKVRDLALHLLDRQVRDLEGRAVSKVDDLELTSPPEGGAPYVTAILCGPHALGPRLGGLLGSWVTFWARVLGQDQTSEPQRIGMELVTELGPSITVSRNRRDLGVHANEDRAADYLVARLPGARHESK